MVDGSQEWSVAREGRRLYRKYRKGRQGVRIVLNVIMHLECVELSLRINKGEYGLGLKRGQAKGDIIGHVQMTRKTKRIRQKYRRSIHRP